MIEKVMRVVKSSNKKRGKNITIGAVVGFLLSCSTVMGAGVIGLEIKKDGNEIKFSKEGSPFTLENPYTGNSWKNNTYRNNMTISRYGSGGTVFGLKLNGNLGENFNFENNGRMNGSSYAGIGVEVDNVSMMGDIANRGILSGHGSIGYGIRYTRYSTSNITNTGIIYGKTNAIDNDYGTVNKAHNYGLLVNNNIERNVVSNNLIIAISTETAGKNKMKNYGLAFTATNFGYKNYNTSNSDFGASHFNKDIDGVTYTIINVGANVNSATKEIKDWRNLGIKNGKLYENAGNISSSEIAGFSSSKQYILNGIEDTLKIIGTDKNNILNNSIINAYKTALVMEGDSNLTLENTIVNGGLDGISSAISVTGNNNFLTIKGDSIVNGEMSATGDMNTLNLYGKEDKTRVDEDKSMNILHNIDGFGRIQIENEVTFFEDVKVTGVDRLNINNGGTLSLRLKAGATSNDKATHALSSGNLVLLIAGKQNDDDTAGTLNFITNGMGIGTIIDMNGAELENVLLKASSIISKLKVLDNRDIELGTGEDLNKVYNDGDITPDSYPKYKVIPDNVNYNSLNKIYQSSVKDDDNVNAVIDMIDSTFDNEQWEKLLKFLGGVYTESPYSYSSELSRKSAGMFRDITTENEFKPNLNNWLIMGGLTHTDGGTKDTYYGKNYYEIDSGSSNTNADMKLTGAYMLAKYSYSESLSLGLTLGGNKSEAKLDMSKVKGNSGYLGAFAENYRGNLTLKAGAGIQYSEYDADRRTIGGHSYNDKYSDMTYDIYLNGRYSNPIGDNLFLEPYGTLSYTYIDQDGTNEGSEALAIETDSKSFDYTVGKVGIDLKKVIPHSNGKSTLSAGVSYTKIFDGADEEYITGRFKGGSDFDILVAHKNEHSIGLNAKYTLELENGVLFDVKGTYSIERDSHNDSGKNKTKGEWIIGAGVGYKF